MLSGKGQRHEGDMSSGHEPIMVIGSLIEFTGTPAERGEQSKHGPVSEQTRSCMRTSACWRRVKM